MEILIKEGRKMLHSHFFLYSENLSSSRSVEELRIPPPLSVPVVKCDSMGAFHSNVPIIHLVPFVLVPPLHFLLSLSHSLLRRFPVITFNQTAPHNKSSHSTPPITLIIHDVKEGKGLLNKGSLLIR